MLLLFTALLFLIYRLGHIQFVKGEEYQRMANIVIRHKKADQS